MKNIYKFNNNFTPRAGQRKYMFNRFLLIQSHTFPEMGELLQAEPCVGKCQHQQRSRGAEQPAQEQILEAVQTHALDDDDNYVDSGGGGIPSWKTVQVNRINFKLIFFN